MFKWNKWFMFLILLIISVLLCSSSSFAVNTNLTIKDVECCYSEEFTISLHLMDENSASLNNKKVTISIDGWKFDDLYTDSKGRVDLAVPYDYDGIWYDVGTYKISASFSGSGEYSPSSANGKVTILQMPTKMTMKYDENKRKVFFSLVDKNNNPAGSVCIDLYIDNKYYEYALTDEYGKGSIDISHLNPGEYLLSANINELLDNYISDNNSMKIEVNKSNENGNTQYNSENSNLHSLAYMQNTGIPIILVVLSFLSVFFSLFYYKKK